MSRHRDVRNLDAGDFDEEAGDYGSSYGSSYTDEVALSKSVEQEYMFRRNASGTTPKLNHFLGRTNSVTSVPEEEDDSDDSSSSSSSTGGRARSRRHSSGSSLVEALDDAESAKLASCLDYILDIVGDTMPEIQIKETIIKCDFNAELALGTLLNSPQKVDSSSLSDAPRRPTKIKPKPTKSSPPPCDDVPAGPKVVVSVDDNEQPKALARIENGNDPVFAAPSPAGPTPVKKAPTRLPIRSRSPSPSPSTPGSTVKMRKTRVDGAKEYARMHGPAAKDLINLVVVGHVDSGKSTLMGHLLVELGQVSGRAMHKYESESRKVGKASFAYAWVLDETAEERNRGITMDVGQNAFETPTRRVRLLDSPGHRDFIPNMISGAYEADSAVLVVNATRGEFEAGFDSGGQTREHAVLVRSMGISQVIVAVNKLDTVDWSVDRFNLIVDKLRHFLKTSVGFKDADTCYIPVSGLTGENLTKRATMIPWYSGPTLVEAIDRLRAPERLVERPFSLAASDAFKPAIGSGVAVAGRIVSGFVLVNDKVLVQPVNEIAIVRGIENAEGCPLSPDAPAFAGEHVSLVLASIDSTASVSAGSVIVDPACPLPVTRQLRAKIVVFTVDVPITKGFQCILHYGSVQVAAVVKKLVGMLDRSTGDVATDAKRPRLLMKGANAIVEISTDIPVCIDTYSNAKELGRFMLRSRGKTIAAGMVTDTS